MVWVRVCEACYCPPWMLVRSYTSREARWATVHLAQSMRPSGQVAHFGLGANKSERARRTDLIVAGGGDAFWSMRQRLSRRTETRGIDIAVLSHGTSMPWHVSVRAGGMYGTGLQYNAELVRGGARGLQFTELPLHPDPVHLQLPFPVHDEAAVYSELLDREERMRPLLQW